MDDQNSSLLSTSLYLGTNHHSSTHRNGCHCVSWGSTKCVSILFYSLMLWICPCFSKLILLPVLIMIVKNRLCWQFQNHNCLWQVTLLAPLTCHLSVSYDLTSCHLYSFSQADGPASIHYIASLKEKKKRETCYSYSLCSKVTHDILFPLWPRYSCIWPPLIWTGYSCKMLWQEGSLIIKSTTFQPPNHQMLRLTSLDWQVLLFFPINTERYCSTVFLAFAASSDKW